MKIFLLVIGSMVLLACGGNQNGRPIENPTQGTMTIYCDDQVAPLMQEEIASFDSTYPNAHIALVNINAREAVVKLLSGETKLIVLGRKFLPDEQALVTKYNVTFEEYEVAHDALAVIVNRRNPLDTLSCTALGAILTGALHTWSGLAHGFAAPLVTVVPNANASAYRHMVDEVTTVDLKTADVVCDTAAKVVQRVRSDAGAIGITDWNQVWNDTTVKVLRMAGSDSTGTLLAPVMLHPAYIHLKTYPLRHSVFAYTTEGHPALAKGFMAFVCNAQGQRIALNQKLVPSSQIIRLREPE